MLPASVLGLVLAVSPDASAVAWEVPLACPGPRELERRVEAYLGRALSETEREDAIVRGLAGRVREGGDGRFELDLTIDAQRHRLADHDCRRLTELAASLLAIAVDPLALGEPVVPLEHDEPAIPVLRGDAMQTRVEPSEQPPSEPATPDREPLVEPVGWELVATSEVDRPPARPGRWRGLALADAGLTIGLFPNVAPQVHGGVGFDLHDEGRRMGARLEIEGGAALAGRFRATDGRELGGDLLAWDVAIRPCVAPRWGLVDLRGCASVGAGQLRGRGVGVQNPQTIAQPWVWAGADLGLAVALHRRDARPRVAAALFVDLGLGLNVVRPNFVILDAGGGADLEFVLPLASGRGRLGVELRFF